MGRISCSFVGSGPVSHHIYSIILVIWTYFAVHITSTIEANEIFNIVTQKLNYSQFGAAAYVLESYRCEGTTQDLEEVCGVKQALAYFLSKLKMK